MKRRALLLVLIPLLLALQAAEKPNPDFAVHLMRFHEHYNKFMRAYLGCPKGAVDIAECQQKQGAIDYYEFNKAAHEARELFSFEK